MATGGKPEQRLVAFEREDIDILAEALRRFDEHLRREMARESERLGHHTTFATRERYMTRRGRMEEIMGRVERLRERLADAAGSMGEF
jgi:hypothetical protein